MRLGVVANEFFEPGNGRVGGFGWAARNVARLFAEDSGLGVEVVLLSGEPRSNGRLDGVPVLAPGSNRLGYARRVRAARLDLLLTIDYRPTYLPILLALPRTPLVVWVRDPRSPRETAVIDSLRLPGGGGARAAGTAAIDCTSVAHVARAARLLRRPLLWASPAASTVQRRAAGTYGLEVPPLRPLPNPVDLNGEPPPRAESRHPRVVLLGRTDPIKRPWLFIELGRRVPEAEFLLLGQRHVDGAVWKPRDLPPNVRMLGHVDGDEKLRLLASAWALVSTSVHEALPVSFLEALACGTPLVACHDPESTVSRFGVDVGRWDGDGLAGLPAFEAGLRRLIDDGEERRRLGARGREWVAATHTRRRFLDSFASLCRDAGVALGA